MDCSKKEKDREQLPPRVVTAKFVPIACPNCGDPHYIDGCPDCGYGISGRVTRFTRYLGD